MHGHNRVNSNVRLHHSLLNQLSGNLVHCKTGGFFFFFFERAYVRLSHHFDRTKQKCGRTQSRTHYASATKNVHGK